MIGIVYIFVSSFSSNAAAGSAFSFGRLSGKEPGAKPTVHFSRNIEAKVHTSDYGVT